MAFPQVRASNGSFLNQNTSFHTLVLPVLETGDLVICYVSFRNDDSITEFPGDWTTLANDVVPPGDHWRTYITYRRIDGTEGYVGDGSDTIQVRTSGSQQMAMCSQSYTDAADPSIQPPDISVVTARIGGTFENFNSLIATGGVQDYLWVAFGAFDHNTWPTEDVEWQADPSGWTVAPINGSVYAGAAVVGKESAADSNSNGHFTLTDGPAGGCNGYQLAIWPTQIIGGGFGSLGL